jgi:YggT family protein
MPLIFHMADLLLTALIWLLLADCVLSWFPSTRGNPLARLVRHLCSPLLQPFRAILPSLGGLDFSPILAILLLTLLQRLLHTGQL